MVPRVAATKRVLRVSPLARMVALAAAAVTVTALATLALVVVAMAQLHLIHAARCGSSPRALWAARATSTRWCLFCARLVAAETRS